jgi:hypothetical protein
MAEIKTGMYDAKIVSFTAAEIFDIAGVRAEEWELFAAYGDDAGQDVAPFAVKIVIRPKHGEHARMRDRR